MGFTMTKNFPVLEILFSDKAIAFIKTGDRDLEIRKIKKVLGKFFFTPYGVFELDSRYEYRYGKIPIYLFNSTNAKPLSIPALQKIQQLYRKNELKDLVDEMQKIDKAVKEANISDPLKILEYIVRDKGGTPIDLATEKWLMSYRAYDPASIRVLITQAHQAKKAIEALSPNIKAALPMIIVFGCVAGFAILVMNMGSILKAFADFIDRIRSPPPVAGFIFDAVHQIQHFLQYLN